MNFREYIAESKIDPSLNNFLKKLAEKVGFKNPTARNIVSQSKDHVEVEIPTSSSGEPASAKSILAPLGFKETSTKSNSDMYQVAYEKGNVRVFVGNKVSLQGKNVDFITVNTTKGTLDEFIGELATTYGKTTPNRSASANVVNSKNLTKAGIDIGMALAEKIGKTKFNKKYVDVKEYMNRSEISIDPLDAKDVLHLLNNVKIKGVEFKESNLGSLVVVLNVGEYDKSTVMQELFDIKTKI